MIIGKEDMKMKIREIENGCVFRNDARGKFNGSPVVYAGRTYYKMSDDSIMGSDGRIWSLADCGFTQETEIIGPIWGKR